VVKVMDFGLAKLLGDDVPFSARHSDGKVRLYVRDLDADEPRVIEGTEGAGYPFWSPDSRSIGYFDGSQLVVVGLAGESRRIMCDAPNGKGGSWGPDGTIVFAAGAARFISSAG
jgi:eukaryotic-like serine/threonine-protein kinase